MTDNINNIKHVVVLMLENRGFDNMAGWIYADQQNRLRSDKVIPADSKPVFDGLLNQNNQGFDDTKCCPAGTEPGAKQLAAQYGTTGTLTHSQFRLPAMDPHEEFDHITYQIFGPHGYDSKSNELLPNPVKKQPPYNTPPSMKGFAIDYATNLFEKDGATEIMECYSPEQANVTAQLARAYSISDAYFSSCPTQTYPNRAFMAAGTSGGRVNNTDFHLFRGHEPTEPTIFNALYDAEQEAMQNGNENDDYSWCVYYSDYSLTKQHTGLIHNLPEQDRQKIEEQGFKSIQKFYAACDPNRSETLPAYSFLEPHYLPSWFVDIKGANSNHPPGYISSGEQLVYDVYNALIASDTWKDTLLIINYDEHGGCYDHVPPPWGAKSPDAASNPSKYSDAQDFRFDRFGVRVPMMMISPWIDSGVVFRGQSNGPPLDHTSILATILDWKSIPRNKLKSERVQVAQSLGYALTGDGTTPPVKIKPPAGTEQDEQFSDDCPLTSLQRGIVHSLARSFGGDDFAKQRYNSVLTLAQFREFLNEIKTE